MSAAEFPDERPELIIACCQIYTRRDLTV